MAEPLNESEWSRFWHLLGVRNNAPNPPPNPDAQKQAQAEHDELADLHAKAQAYIDEWKPDAKAASAHLVGVIEHLFGAVQQIASILPAAGALMAKLPVIQSAVENASVALKGPANIPPMPDPPDPPPEAIAPEPQHAPEVVPEQAPGETPVVEEPVAPPTDGAPVSSGGAEAPQPEHGLSGA